MKGIEKHPVIPTGMSRLTLALKAPRPTRSRVIDTNLWHTEYLSEDMAAKHKFTLADMGYTNHEIEDCGLQVEETTGIGDCISLFTAEGSKKLRESCQLLEKEAASSDWIISRRLRGATQFSRLINDMMNDRAFLLKLSKFAGVPLIPHPMVRARSQVNYFKSVNYSNDEHPAEIGMWHRDGTSFVVNILLSDSSEFEGGNFYTYTRKSDEFDKDAIVKSHVYRAKLKSVGDSGFICGNKVFHAVEPVTKGQRMSLILSFHCPYSTFDANEFWHIASDDGLLPTVKSWFKFKLALTKRAEQQYREIGCEQITFEDLKE